jgi:hypothetical protein
LLGNLQPHSEFNLSGLLAIIAMTEIGLASAQMADNATMGNMTGGNMTSGNTTEVTGSISSEMDKKRESEIFGSTCD